MTQIQCSALLFDLDGVLIDSTPAVARVWHQWALEHGLNPEEVVARAHGRPSLATVRDYLPNADHDAENREVERREIADLAGVVPLPGALVTLRLPSIAAARSRIPVIPNRPCDDASPSPGAPPLPSSLISSSIADASYFS